jgi:hypothetical protein
MRASVCVPYDESMLELKYSKHIFKKKKITKLGSS